MFDGPQGHSLDYSIEGVHGRFRVRFRDRDGREHVIEFATKTEARDYVEQLRRFPLGKSPDAA